MPITVSPFYVGVSDYTWSVTGRLRQTDPTDKTANGKIKLHLLKVHGKYA